MTAPDVVGIASATNDSIAFPVNVPAGTTDGDLLIAVVASDWNTDAANSFPTPAWTKLTTSSYSGGTDAWHTALYARVASSEPASYTVGLGTSSANVAAIMRITGWDSAGGIAGAVKEVAPVITGTGTTAPSIVPWGTDDLLLTFHGGEFSGSAARTWLPPAGMTEILDLQSTVWTSLEINTLANPSNPSGSKVATPSTGTDNGVGCTISIKSASGGAAVVQDANPTWFPSFMQGPQWPSFMQRTPPSFDSGVVASSTTPVGADLGIVWNTRATLGDTLQAVWDTRAPAGKDLGLVWNTRIPLGDTLQLIWDTRAAVGDTLQAVWDTREAVGDPLQVVWNTRAAIGDPLQLLWDVRVPIGDTLQAVWDVRLAVGDPLGLVWDVRAPVGDSLQLVWDVQSPLTAIGKDLSFLWNTKAAIGDPLQLVWDTRIAVGDPLQLIWNTRISVGDPLQLIWNTREAVGDPLQLIWNTRQAVGDPLQLIWNTRTSVGDPLQFLWNTRAPSGKELQLLWNVLSLVPEIIVDIEVTIGPTRRRNRALILPTRKGIAIGNTRKGWIVGETRKDR